MPLKIFVITPDEFRAFYGQEPPAVYYAVIGYEGDVLAAVGGVQWDAWGRCWGFYDAKEKINRFTMHRVATRILAALKQAGASVATTCDWRIEGSERWLRGLGFRPVGKGIWAWRG